MLGGRLPHPEDRDDHRLTRELEVHVVLLVHHAGDLVPARAGAANVDREPQRVVPVHARPSGDALVEHVEPRQLADRLARALERLDRLREERLASFAASRRAASSDPSRSEFGLVDSTSVTARSTPYSSIRPTDAWPRWSIADWVKLRRSCAVLDTHQVGARRERVLRKGLVEGECAPRPRPRRAGRRGRARRRSARVRRPRAPKYVGDTTDRAGRARGLGKRAVERLGVRQCAIPRSGSSSGRRRSAEPREDQPVDRARVDISLHHHTLAGLRSVTHAA